MLQMHQHVPKRVNPLRPAAKVTFALLLLFAAAVTARSGTSDRQSADSSRPHAAAVQSPSITLKTISRLAPAPLLILFQRERGGAAPARPDSVQGCMRVRERVGWVANTSLFVVVIVAVIIYALLMSYAARKIPPLGTWLLAPALSALLVGFLASSYAAGQLAGACPEESSAFPLDRFLYVALWGFVMTLIVFSLLSVGKWYHREKRMRVATE